MLRRRHKLNALAVTTASQAQRLMAAVNRGPRFTGFKASASTGESRTFIFVCVFFGGGVIFSLLCAWLWERSESGI